LASVNYLERRNFIGYGIGLIGLSIGGAASIYAASLDSRINAVVTVGAFANPADVMRKQFHDRHIPYWPFVWMVLKVIQWRIGVDYSEIAPVNNIAKADARFLIIHGEKDAVVPLEQAHQLIQAANAEKSTLITYKNKAHSNCHFEKGFWKTVDKFIELPE